MSELRRICLSGGGILAFQFLGCLQFVTETTSLAKVNEYIGTSVGAILCYLLAIGYKPTELLLKLIMTKAWNTLRHPNLVALIQGDGAYSFSPIHEVLEKLSIEKIGKLPTLGGLKEQFGASLTCITYNLTTRKQEILSPDTYPDLPCLTAIRMSSCIPFLFESYRYGEGTYIDGATVNNFPIDVFTDDKPTLAICLATELPPRQCTSKEFNMMAYSLDIVTASGLQHTKYMVKKARESTNVELIQLADTGIEIFEFTIDIPQKLDLFSQGYRDAREQFLVDTAAAEGKSETTEDCVN